MRMNHILQLTLLLTMIVFVSMSFNSQNLTSNASLYPTESTYSIPKRVDFISDSGGRLISYFLPIGWSKSGKFAYITEPADEACGCYFFEIAIMDLVTDKLIWNWKFEGEDQVETIQSVWTKNLKLFENKLNEYGIIQLNEFKLQKTSFESDDKQYNIELFTESNKNWDFENLQTLRIDVKSQELGQKTITNYNLKEYDFVLEAGLSGHIKSPFEDRIAVIYYQVIRGWEGPPNVIKFKITGSHLNVRFKKHNKH